jgi:hypothetical protein
LGKGWAGGLSEASSEAGVCVVEASIGWKLDSFTSMPKVTPVDYDTVVPADGDKERSAATSNKPLPNNSGKYIGNASDDDSTGLDEEETEEIFRRQQLIRGAMLETSMTAIDSQLAIIPNYSNVPLLQRPVFMPKKWPLNIVFFRQIYSRLRLTHPKGKGVDVEVFHSRIERLFKAFGNKNAPAPSVFKLKDKDNSGFITWQEAAEIWRDEGLTVNLSFLEQVYLTLDQQGCSSSVIAWTASTTIMATIALSSCMFLLASMPSMKVPPCSRCEPKVHSWFADIESVACVLFTAEYVIRFLCVHKTRIEFLDNNYLLDYVTKDVEMKAKTGFGRTIAFATEASNLIDLLAILPCYITQVLPPNTNLTVLRLIRLSRIFRVLKMGNLSHAKDVLVTTMEYSWPSLSMVLFIIVMWVLVFSVLVYLLEMGKWDENLGIFAREGEESPSPFSSIPATVWWTIVTVTTVGYGDFAPIEPSGRFAGTVTIIGGVIAFAMPVGIIASQFDKASEEYEAARTNVSSSDKKAKVHEKQDICEVLRKFGGDGRAEIRFEVYHRNPDVDAIDFMGVASIDLRKLRLPTEHSSSVQLTMPLQQEPTISAHKVSGALVVCLYWLPDICNALSDYIRPIKLGKAWSLIDAECCGEIPLLRGKLTVEVQSASGIENIALDGQSNTFVRICCCPTRSKTAPTPQVWDTQVCPGTGSKLNPVWGSTKEFDIDWASHVAQEDPDREPSCNGPKAPKEAVRLPSQKMAAVMMFPAKRIVELQKEVLELRRIVEEAPECDAAKLPGMKRGSFSASWSLNYRDEPAPEAPLPPPDTKQEDQAVKGSDLNNIADPSPPASPASPIFPLPAPSTNSENAEDAKEQEPPAESKEPSAESKDTEKEPPAESKDTGNGESSPAKRSEVLD